MTRPAAKNTATAGDGAASDAGGGAASDAGVDAIRERKIGVFDSGVGGLTVLRALRKAMPHERFVYLGDTARVPYGNKGAETIRRYSRNIARTLTENYDCKALVIACNTASAYAFDTVNAQTDVPVFDVIQPVAHDVSMHCPNGRVLVLGTRATIRSEAYVKALHTLRPDLQIEQQACPLFVPLAEEGWTDGDVVFRIAETYLEPVLHGFAPDSIILGCTHYPLLAPIIREVVDALGHRKAAIYDTGAATSRHVRGHLEEAELCRLADRPGSCDYLVTDDVEAFLPVGSRFLGHPVLRAEHVDILP